MQAVCTSLSHLWDIYILCHLSATARHGGCTTCRRCISWGVLESPSPLGIPLPPSCSREPVHGGVVPCQCCWRWVQFHWFFLILWWVHLHGLHTVVWLFHVHCLCFVVYVSTGSDLPGKDGVLSVLILELLPFLAKGSICVVYPLSASSCQGDKPLTGRQE